MVIENVSSRLDNLSKLAPQLNKATDLYMDELREIEKQVNKLNLGIAIEFGGVIKTENPYFDYLDDGTEDGISGYIDTWELGYGRYQDAWCLLVRKYKLVDRSTEVMQVENVTPLLQSSRELRIAAAEKIPELLEKIEEAVKGKIETLGKISDKR